MDDIPPFTARPGHALVAHVSDLWIALLSTRGRRRRPSIRVGLPWGTSVAAWFVMARLAVDGRAFHGSWVYWLAVGGLVMPAAVVLASMVAGVWPTRRSVGASVLASLIGTFLGLLVLHLSREPMPFAILGGFVVSLLATGSYVVASSTGEVARRDLEDP